MGVGLPSRLATGEQLAAICEPQPVTSWLLEMNDLLESIHPAITIRRHGGCDLTEVGWSIHPILKPILAVAMPNGVLLRRPLWPGVCPINLELRALCRLR